MINLREAVGVVLLMIVAAVAFVLLYWMIEYISWFFPGGGGARFAKIADVVLVVLAVLLAVGVLVYLVVR